MHLAIILMIQNSNSKASCILYDFKNLAKNLDKDIFTREYLSTLTGIGDIKS